MRKKLNVLLAQTDQLGAVMKKNLTDSIATFNGKQGHFKGEKKVFTWKKDEFATEGSNIDKPVNSTVREWFDYTFKEAGKFMKAKLDQEATNCSGTAKAKLVIGDKDFGELTTGELMALKGFFEQTALRQMFDSAPTLSLTENWAQSTNLEYQNRDVKQSPEYKWVDKVVENTPKVEWDPLGKQPGVTIQIKNTIEKADVARQLFSGEITHIEKAQILERLTTIIVAIKSALEEANTVEIQETSTNVEDIFKFLLTGTN